MAQYSLEEVPKAVLCTDKKSGEENWFCLSENFPYKLWGNKKTIWRATHSIGALDWLWGSQEHWEGKDKSTYNYSYDLTPLFAAENETAEKGNHNEGLVRVVLDIKVSNVSDLFGTTESQDDAVVLDVVDLLEDQKISGGTIKSVNWLTYVANPTHLVNKNDQVKTALHPKLRECKADTPAPKIIKSEPDFLDKAVFLKNVLQNKVERFILAAHCPPGKIKQWQQDHLPFYAEDPYDQIWHEQGDGYWYATSQSFIKEDGWDISPLFDTEKKYPPAAVKYPHLKKAVKVTNPDNEKEHWAILPSQCPLSSEIQPYEVYIPSNDGENVGVDTVWLSAVGNYWWPTKLSALIAQKWDLSNLDLKETANV